MRHLKLEIIYASLLLLILFLVPFSAAVKSCYSGLNTYTQLACTNTDLFCYKLTTSLNNQTNTLKGCISTCSDGTYQFNGTTYTYSCCNEDNCNADQLSSGVTSCYAGFNSFSQQTCPNNSAYCYIATVSGNGRSHTTKGCSNSCKDNSFSLNDETYSQSCCSTNNCNANQISNGVQSCYVGSSISSFGQRSCGGIYKYCSRAFIYSAGQYIITKSCENTCSTVSGTINGIFYDYSCCETNNCNIEPIQTNSVTSCYLGTNTFSQEPCGSLFKYCASITYIVNGQISVRKTCENVCNEGSYSANGIFYSYSCCQTNNCNSESSTSTTKTSTASSTLTSSASITTETQTNASIIKTPTTILPPIMPVTSSIQSANTTISKFKNNSHINKSDQIMMIILLFNIMIFMLVN